MDLFKKQILKILDSHRGQFLTRSELESEIKHIKKRAILAHISSLVDAQRIEVLGQSSSTVYQISDDYFNNSDFAEKLFLYQNQILVGYLGYDGEFYSFSYDTDYLLRDKHDVIFEMPLDITTYHQEKCFVDFEELIPEGMDKKILIEKTGNATEFFLIKNNTYNLNDLIFSPDKISFKHEPKLEQQSYLAMKNNILSKNDFPNILNVSVEIDYADLFPSEIMDEETIRTIRTVSLSGYQHKIPVIIEEGIIRLPNKNEAVSYFAKPYHPKKADENDEYYFPHIAINEHLHLSFAKNELGFDVPMSGIFKSKDDKEYHYVVKYFDRHKSYKFQRKEFSTYLGLDSENKYNTSSEKLFEKASEVFSREEDRLRMLEYYFYSFVIRHEDMHTKNISTIIDKDKTILAPLYDIATTAFYNGIKNYESHLSINGKQTNIRLKDFLHLVDRANVDKKKFLERAKVILITYSLKMPKYIKKVATLENTDFYIKDRPNAQGVKIKIKEKVHLSDVMQNAFIERVKTLETNLWFEQLEIDKHFFSPNNTEKGHSLVDDVRNRNQLKRFQNKIKSALSNNEPDNDFTTNKKP